MEDRVEMVIKETLLEATNPLADRGAPLGQKNASIQVEGRSVRRSHDVSSPIHSRWEEGVCGGKWSDDGKPVSKQDRYREESLGGRYREESRGGEEEKDGPGADMS